MHLRIKGEAMPRGSKPGERRGGRQRATPNRRTVLTDRVLAVATANPSAAIHELVLILAKDQGLPADTRLVLARKAFPFGSRSMRGPSNSVARADRPTEPATEIRPHHVVNNERPAFEKGPAIGAKAGLALDLLLTVARDTVVSLANRRKAASQAAEFFLPKNPKGKRSRRGKFSADECGFVVDPELARELRDKKLKLACLGIHKNHRPYAIAQKARKLQARIEEVQLSLQCPCPSKYTIEHFTRDKERLAVFSRRRALGNVFTPEEDAEEALRTARYDSFLHGPEVAARVRLKDLREKKRAADGKRGPPLTPAQETTLRFLTVLYPLPPRPSPDEQTIAEHSFQNLPLPVSAALRNSEPLMAREAQCAARCSPIEYVNGRPLKFGNDEAGEQNA